MVFFFFFQSSKEQNYEPGGRNGVTSTHVTSEGQHAVGMVTSAAESSNQEDVLKTLKGDLQFSIEETPPGT